MKCEINTWWDDLSASPLFSDNFLLREEEEDEASLFFFEFGVTTAAGRSLSTSLRLGNGVESSSLFKDGFEVDLINFMSGLFESNLAGDFLRISRASCSLWARATSAKLLEAARSDPGANLHKLCKQVFPSLSTIVKSIISSYFKKYSIIF